MTGIATSTEAAVESGDLVFGLSRLFIREDLIDALEQLRLRKSERVLLGALLIQSVW